MDNSARIPLAIHPPETTYTIRLVELDDVATLHKGLWHHRQPDDIQDFIGRVLKFMQQKRGIAIVVIDEPISTRSIVAYGQVTQWMQCSEISDLYVSPTYRSQGIGTAMIQYLTRFTISQRVECVELGVAESNPRALNLYRQLGFTARYTLQLDLGQGHEPVIYLSLDLTPYH